MLHFGAGDNDQVEARAVVVWARGDGERDSPGMGLRFEDVDGKKLEQIRRIIEGERKNGQLGA